MRALVVTEPGHAAVQDVEPPHAGAGQLVVDVARVGLCGTDVELFRGEMAYQRQGLATFPLRLGHEWCGVVSAVGLGVDPGWLGGRVTADTMIGCGRCRRCLAGRHWVCPTKSEIGIQGRYPGALAEQIAVPATALHRLPVAVNDAVGALVEPAANAWRAVDAAAVGDGDNLLVFGLGAIGLLCGLLAAERGVRVQMIGATQPSIAFARELGLAADLAAGVAADSWSGPWDAVIDASNSAEVPPLALQLVEPGRRVVLIGLAPSSGPVDSRLLALGDVTAVGILGGSAGLEPVIATFGSGAVDPAPLVAATVGLDQVAQVLAGGRPAGAGNGPKVQVDPRLLDGT